jgi:hypothetical protein
MDIFNQLVMELVKVVVTLFFVFTTLTLSIRPLNTYNGILLFTRIKPQVIAQNAGEKHALKD